MPELLSVPSPRDRSTELILDLEGVQPSPIEPRQELAFGGRKLLVFDDVFTSDFVESFGVFLLRQDYEPRPSFDNELSAGMDADVISSLPALPEVAEALVARHHARMAPVPAAQSLSHGYAAAIRFGDSSVVHQDIPCGDCLTFLYYGNLAWTGRWGGETIFYDDELAAVAAISPKPGRLVLFNAAIHHRAGIPSRICPTFRYTFSLFYRCQRMREGQSH
jgi:2-oxoglutarate-Fe(II)-dependent oxygenase superfamily protein